MFDESSAGQQIESWAHGSMRVCIYMRVSTGRQAESDLSIPDQRRQLNAYAVAHGWNVVSEFVDAGLSATDDRRPAFRDMIDQATDSQHPFDVILVHSFSRFYRDSLYSEWYIRKLRKAEVRVISITQPSTDDPAGNLIRNVISLFDAHQSLENGKHVLRSMKENARQGFYNGSPLPLGYTTEFVERRGNKDKKKIVVDPVEAELVRVIFDLYTKGDGNSGSLGVKEIVSRLNRNGYRTRRGNLFGVSGIHNLLQNRIYIGEYTFNKTCSKTKKEKDISEHICVEVDPIIPRAQFDDVQSLLKKRSPRVTPPRETTGPILLTGLATCASCGGGMTLRTGTARNGTVHRYYTCSTCARSGKTACKGRSIRMDKLDELVVEHLSERLFTEERVAEILSQLSQRRAARSAEVDRRTAALKNKIEAAEEKLRRLYAMVENGIAELDDILRDRIKALQDERDLVKEALSRAQATASREIIITEDMIKRFAEAMRTHIRSGEIPFRKAYLKAVIDRIDVDTNVIRITGSKDTLERAVQSDPENLPAAVRSSVPKWRARKDSNL